MHKDKIIVVGLGYVGLPLAILAKKNKYNVIGIDRNTDRIAAINNKISPFKDDFVSKEIKKFPIEATVNFSVIKDASTIIICVPTPVDDNHKPDLEPVTSSCTDIAKYLEKNQLVILESTVNPGITREVILPILEKGSGLIAGKDFYVAHCPERINPGSKKWNAENITRVIGGLEKVSLKKAVKFYSSILKAPVKIMHSIEETEAVKILENCFRDVNIALVNEFAMSFDKLGIDIIHVLEGASTKPFSFLIHYPGCGVGGHCISVDPYYMIEHAASHGFNHQLISLAREINNNMPKYTVELVIQGLQSRGIEVKRSTVVVLGIAYKKNIADFRESPSFKIIHLLENLGVNVKTYDPYILDKSSDYSLDHALNGVDAVILATNHNEFVSLRAKTLLEKGISIVIDGRNCLNKEEFLKAGIYYKGIGR